MNYPNRSVPNPNLVNEDKNISFANRGIDFEKAINTVYSSFLNIK